MTKGADEIIERDRARLEARDRALRSSSPSPRRMHPQIGALLCAALLLAGSGPGCTPDANGASTASGEGASVESMPAPAVRQASQSLEDDRSTAVVRASERVAPAVVAVNVLRTRPVQVRNPFFDDFFGGFFGAPGGQTRMQQVPSLGSGFVVDPQGTILTNDHVVRGAERILVTLPDGRDAEAVLVGSDEATDVAVLRIDEPDLPVAPLGRSDDLRIGEWVIAFGNPFGNLISNPEPTVTVGVVSAIRRHIVPSGQNQGFYLGMIQTDAAINPGNSGGPLVNALGEVIGMNASIFSRSGGSEGLGFAIPIERVLQISDDLIEHGRVRRAWLGLDIEPVEADDFGRTRGVRVTRVAADSPADRSGLGSGDRLIEMNGARLTTPLDFEAILLDLRAGDPVQLLLESGNAPIRIQAAENPLVTAERVTVLRDLEVVTLTPAIQQEQGVASEAGALVTNVASGAQSVLGLQAGDVIVGVNNRRVGSAAELASAMESLPAGSRVRLIFERNRGLATREFVLGR